MLTEIVYDGPQPRNLEELEGRVDEAVLVVNLDKQQRLMTLEDSVPKPMVGLLRKNGEKNSYRAVFLSSAAVLQEGLTQFHSVLIGQIGQNGSINFGALCVQTVLASNRDERQNKTRKTRVRVNT